MKLGHRARGPGGPDLLVRAIAALGVVAVSVLVGTQYLAPDKRMLALIAAAVIFGVAWRLDTIAGLGLLIVAIPYPRGTVFGNTNFAFILLVLLLWLLRYYAAPESGSAPHAARLSDRRTAARVCGFLLQHSRSGLARLRGAEHRAAGGPRWCSTTC